MTRLHKTMRHARLPLLFVLSILLAPGCASTNKTPIAYRGDVMAEGSNNQLSTRAPAMGMVSVYDDTTRALVHSGVVGPGTVVNLNPLTGTISVTDFQSNGTQVVYTAVNQSHHYTMTFIPQGTAGASNTQMMTPTTTPGGLR
jgi:hypothetical protein